VVTVRRAGEAGEGHDPTVTVDRLPWPAGKVAAVEAAVSPPGDDALPDNRGLERLLRDLGGDLGPLIKKALDPAALGNGRPSLILMPTGALHRVPFHAIPWMADGATWDGTTRLADVARVSYVATPDVLVLRAREAARGPALGALADTHETTPARPEVAQTTLAAVAPGVADVSGERVPNLTVALAHATTRLVPRGSQALVTTRARATRHAVLGQAALAGVDIALVATHGRAGEDTGGRRSGLLLHADHGASPGVGQADLGDARGTGPEGTWVTARELLTRLPLDGTRHVQLLACETHADGPAPGDELAGLVSTFLIRGAASVAGTLWAVNEVAACLVGWWLTRAVADGATPVNAFHGAVDRLRHARPGDIVEALDHMRPATTTDEAALAAVDACRAHYRSCTPDWQPFASPVHWAAYVFHGNPN
jgi:CHAT domain-containing protein